MDEKLVDVIQCSGTMEGESEGPKPAYVPPRIVTYTSEELLEQVGPAMACTSGNCPSGN